MLFLTMAADDAISREKLRIWKNVLVISTGFLLQFTSFLSISALQSSVNSDGGLGTQSLTAIYVALLFSSLFLVSWTMDRLTPKWTMVVCNLCYLGYTLAQFHPTVLTMIPSGILVGLAAAPLWSAKCTYVSVVGRRYRELCEAEKRQTGKQQSNNNAVADGVKTKDGTDCDKTADDNKSDVNPAVLLFFGVFFAFFHSAGIWGNLLTSTVLSSGDEPPSASKGRNMSSLFVNDDDISMCGKNFCEDLTRHVENLRRPVEWKIQLLSGIFVGVALCSALLLALFLDPMSKFEAKEAAEECVIHPLKVKSKEKTSTLLMSTLRQMKEPRQALLTVLVFYNGLERGFFDADFNKAFVGCSWGIQNIGYVLMCGKAANSFGSVVSGKLVKYTGRIPLFLSAYVINMAGLVFLINWEPRALHVPTLFIMASVLMVSDALWGTQINGLHGVLFRDNVAAAFSVYKVWESCGFIVAYFVSPLLCVIAKLYGMVAILTVGMACYLAMEFVQSRQSSNERKQPAF